MKHEGQRSLRSNAGFTLIEVIVVMAIMAALMAISIPSFMGWRQNLKYRETAREVASILREAKSRAITNNREQQVQFDAINQKYGLRPGDRAYSTNWSDVPDVSNWAILDSQVKISGDTSLQFTPNGAASASGTIKIKDQDLATKFCVSVIPTGRISVLAPDPVNCT
jgi:prepilin-type N-terminal cleavage/methylation domain-containing protein